MKRTISFLIALIVLLNLAVPSVAASGGLLLAMADKHNAAWELCENAEPDTQTVLSLIIANEGAFSSLDHAREGLFGLAGTLEIAETYENLFYGFAAEISVSLAEKIHASPEFDVQLCGEYSSLETIDAQYETAVMYAIESVAPPKSDGGLQEYTGRGIKVAVIDDGFDITHPAFANTPDGAAFTPEQLDEILAEGELICSSLKELPEGLYKSAKIPFAYNYATNTTDVSTLNNHGTHVAGIIGADCDRLVGIAPDCQLFLMKTFDERVGTATEINVLKALEDAIALEVDIVNLSIGMYAGFSESGALTVMNRAARSLKRAGIVVNCAAGNDGTIGRKSSYYRNYGLALPLSSLTDYGTVNSPAVLESFVAVASAQNTHTADNALIHEENGIERRIPYSDTNAELGVIKGRFIDWFDGQTLEYVEVPGVGEAKDYKKLDVYGKLAFVERGGITFIEKVNHAANAGAVGVIIYNNSTTDTNIKMDVTGCAIPAVLISLEDGEYLKKAARKELTMSTELCGFKPNPEAYKMSGFSSWGVTPDLELKPDITAIGETVYSAAAGGHYTSLSGTSMATPIISGAAALICEKLNSEQSKYVSSKRPDYIKSVLMNTAKPLIHPESEAEYSPRVQGAGLVDISAAASAELILTDPDQNPSVSLGDKLEDNFTLEVVIENISEEELDITINASLLRENAVKAGVGQDGEYEVFNSLNITPLRSAKILSADRKNVNRYADGAEAISVIVPAGEKYELELAIELDPDEMPSKDELPNGSFVDGFVYVTSAKHEYSMPFTGFYGDFAASPIFDSGRYTDLGDKPFLHGNLLISMANDRLSVLGSDDLTINGSINSEYVSFSPNGDGSFDALFFTPSIFRNITELTTEVHSADGNLLFSDTLQRRITKSESSPSEYLNVWDGSDDMNFDYIFPDGDYFITFTAKCFDQAGVDSITLPVKIDTQPPRLVNSLLREADQRRILELTVSDNVGVRQVEVYSGDTVITQLDDGDGIFTFDVTQLEGTIWVDLTDYAMNTKTDIAYTENT